MALLANYEVQDGLDGFWSPTRKGQTFKVTSGAFDITSIEVYVVKSAGSVSGTLYIYDCNQVTHLPTGSVLGTASFSFPSGAGWVVVTLAIPSLLPNHEYAITMLNGADGFHYGSWYRQATGAYTDGTGLTSSNGGGTWATTVKDYMFRVNGTIVYDKVSTVRSTVVTLTTATLAGNITFAPETVLERGFDYGLSAAYGSSVTETAGAPFGTGAYTLPVTDLTFPGTYHFRAKIRAASGWQYGDDMTIAYTGQYEDLLPSGDATYSQFSIFPTTPTSHYDKVRVAGDNQRIYNGVAIWRLDTFTWESLMQRFNTTIKKVKYRVLYQRNNISVQRRWLYRQDAVDTVGGTEQLGTSGFYWKEYLFATNPKDSSAWTFARIDTGLEFGYEVYDSGIPSGGSIDQFMVRAVFVDAAVRTDPATNISIGGTTATLNGFVLEDEGETTCQVKFEWGLTTAYGAATAWQDKVKGQFFSDGITGLDPTKTYHFRAVIKTRLLSDGNYSDGQTFYGADASFDMTHPDRIYVWLGTYADPEQIELTDPDYPLVMGVRTERGRDEELGSAAAGICEMVCDNQFGDFSPENVAGVLYEKLVLGAYITHYEVYKGITYRHFFGKIDKIVPHAEPDNLTAYVLAVDGSDDLAGSEIETPLRLATGAHELLDDIHDAVNWPAADRSFDASIDVLQLGWYHETKALDEIQALENMERGFYLIDVDGIALWQNRHYRVIGARLISQFDFGEEFIELAYEYSKRELRNWCRITGTRYVENTTDPDPETYIWVAPTNFDGAPYIPAGTTVIIWAPLAGPLVSHDALVAGTHWNANSAYDKSGTDLTAQVNLTVTDYGQAIKFTLENTSDKDAYLVVPDTPPSGAPDDTTLLVFGLLYEEYSISVVKEDTTSRDAYGKRTISIDAKFKSNYNDLVSYSEWLISRYKDPLPSPVMGKVSAWTNYPDDTIKLQCLTRKISDRITAASTKHGFDRDFFIDKIIQEYVALEGGWVHNTTYSLSRAEGQAEGQYWLLGEVGFSELGETTRLGF